MSQGNAFDLKLYCDYGKALDSYQGELDDLLIVHVLVCLEEKGAYGLSFVTLKSNDLLLGEPSKRPLTDVSVCSVAITSRRSLLGKAFCHRE